jgi:hypothetical protein
LLSIGLIKKEAGIGKPTSKGVHPVWEYSLVPGALEAVTRNLAIFSNTPLTSENAMLSQRLVDVREKVSAEFGAFPALIVMGGSDDGKVFFIRKPVTLIGRSDPAFSDVDKNDIIFFKGEKSFTKVAYTVSVIIIRSFLSFLTRLVIFLTVRSSNATAVGFAGFTR